MSILRTIKQWVKTNIIGEPPICFGTIRSYQEVAERDCYTCSDYDSCLAISLRKVDKGNI